MGRKAKRIRLLRRIAAKEEAEKQTTLKNENSVKIEEMKAAAPEPVVEKPIVLEEPKEEIIEPPKPEIKKQPAKKAPYKKPAAKKNTKAKSTSRSAKNKKK